MPIYEYECLECGVHFDKLQRFGDPQPEACPHGHRQVQRRLSQPAIIFKGSGFYVTDNPRNGRASSARSSRPDKEAASTPDSGTPSEKDKGKET